MTSVRLEAIRERERFSCSPSGLHGLSPHLAYDPGARQPLSLPLHPPRTQQCPYRSLAL